MSEKNVLDFMRWRWLATTFSLLLLIASLVSLTVRGMTLGLDFTGGTLVEVSFKNPVELQPIRSALESGGIGDAVVQYFGQSSDVLIRIPPTQDEPEANAEHIQNTEKVKKKDELAQTVVSLLENMGKSVELKRIEFVGPQVGEELRDQSGLAMLLALGAMLIYITLRFQFKFAVGAVVALFHDVIIVLGVFSMLGLQFDLTVLAAVLAVIGYSLNDTIVVSDRIRENFRVDRSAQPMALVNLSLGQTLGRTLITSLTTILVLLALKFLGGAMISGFATALLIGVLVGTYSSIYVASNILIMLNFKREDLIENAVELVDDRP